jgi:hypothetical protein
VDRTPPELEIYPPHFEASAHRDVIPKLTLSEPGTGVDEKTFTLKEASGKPVHASVALIGDTTFALFPDQVLLAPSQTYIAEFAGPLCDLNDNCVNRRLSWSFTVTSADRRGSGDTRPPARPKAVLAAASVPIVTAASEKQSKLVLLSLFAAATACAFAAARASRTARLAIRPNPARGGSEP